MLPGYTSQILVFVFPTFYTVACGNLLPHRTVGGIHHFTPAAEGVAAQAVFPHPEGEGRSPSLREKAGGVGGGPSALTRTGRCKKISEL